MWNNWYEYCFLTHYQLSLISVHQGISSYVCEIIDMNIASLPTINFRWLAFTINFRWLAFVCEIIDMNIASLSRHKFLRMWNNWYEYCFLTHYQLSLISVHQGISSYVCEIIDMNIASLPTINFRWLAFIKA